MKVIPAFLAALTAFAICGPVRAQDFNDVAEMAVLPGWRLDDGSHMAALRITLAPGWKTYWRAPGDAGIPPRFDWDGSRNVAGVSVAWPAPVIFDQGGLRSVGYADRVVLPVRLRPAADGAIRLAGRAEIGVCKDICIPRDLAFDAVLPADVTTPDPQIAAALASRPYTAREAGVGRVTCRISPGDRGLTIEAEIEVAPTGAPENVIVETANPEIWVAPARTERRGGRIVARTRMEHVADRAFALDRSGLRLTVLGARRAIDIQGCAAPG